MARHFASHTGEVPRGLVESEGQMRVMRPPRSTVQGPPRMVARLFSEILDGSFHPLLFWPVTVGKSSGPAATRLKYTDANESGEHEQYPGSSKIGARVFIQFVKARNLPIAISSIESRLEPGPDCVHHDEGPIAYALNQICDENLPV
jgi:hypothetical protein